MTVSYDKKFILNKRLHLMLSKILNDKKCEKNHILFPVLVKDLYKFADESKRP